MSRPTPCPICGLVETWHPVRDYEELYEISTTGRVRSLGFTCLANYGKMRQVRGRVLTGPRIALSRPNDQRYVMREVLFVEHFGNMPPGAVHVFFDGDPSHFCTTNLGWEFNHLEYRSMHRKIARVRGKASARQCVDCGLGAQDWSYTKSGRHEVEADWRGCRVSYSLDPSEYAPRCKSCHINLDGWWHKLAPKKARV